MIDQETLAVPVACNNSDAAEELLDVLFILEVIVPAYASPVGVEITVALSDREHDTFIPLN
jgi:hypothetical protein